VLLALLTPPLGLSARRPSFLSPSEDGWEECGWRQSAGWASGIWAPGEGWDIILPWVLVGCGDDAAIGGADSDVVGGWDNEFEVLGLGLEGQRQTTVRRSRARAPLRGEPRMPSMSSQGMLKTPLVGRVEGSVGVGLSVVVGQAFWVWEEVEVAY